MSDKTPTLLDAAVRLHDAALMIELVVSAYASKDTAQELSAALKQTREAIETVKTAADEVIDNQHEKNFPMRVKHLLAQLLKQDPRAEIRIPVQTYTQAYPAGYFIPNLKIERAHDERIRLWVYMPEGYSIAHKRK